MKLNDLHIAKDGKKAYAEDTIKIAINKGEKEDQKAVIIRVATPLVERCELNGGGKFSLEYEEDGSAKITPDEKGTTFTRPTDVKKGEEPAHYVCTKRITNPNVKLFSVQEAVDVTPAKDHVKFTLPDGFLEALGVE